jgi:TonB family protein
MKKTTIIFIGVFVSFFSYGQTEKVLGDIDVTPPKFTGFPISTQPRTESIESYLVQKIHSEVKSIDENDEGTVVVQFVVDASGSLSDYQIVNSVSPFIDNEVISALKATNGMWLPGKNNDGLVPMEKEVSISFRLESNRNFVKRAEWLFKRGTKMLYVKEKPQKALEFYDQGIVLLPNQKCILSGRGLAKYELGDYAGACKDWNRIRSLGGFEGDEYLKNFCKMPGYAEMLNTVNGN